MSDLFAVVQELSTVIAQAIWNAGAEEEESEREASPYGGSDGVLYWDDLEDYHRKALAQNSRTAAMGVWRAGYRKASE